MRNKIHEIQRGFYMDITCGKAMNVLAFKQQSLREFNEQVAKCQVLCRKFLGVSSKLVDVKKCPLCGFDSSYAVKNAIIHGVVYYRCPRCDFRFLKKRLSEKALEDFYRADEVLSAAHLHTSPELTKRRINEIVKPKAMWMLDSFTGFFGKEPRKILDVGAGGGHFVHVLREMGFDACGIEPSKISREYCEKNFNIELYPSKFLDYAENNLDIDVISFFGVLEHIPDFMSFLRATRKIFAENKEALVVVEVPRWTSLSTVVQTGFPDSVVRHLFPLTHIGIFSDNSLSNAFIKTGFVPRAAWYFGMDMYVLLMQLARVLNSEEIIARLGKKLLAYQFVLDEARISDSMIFAGIPK